MLLISKSFPLERATSADDRMQHKSVQEVNLEIAPRIDALHCAKFKVDPGELGLLAIPVRSLAPSLSYSSGRKGKIFRMIFTASGCRGGQIQLYDSSTDCALDLSSNLHKLSCNASIAYGACLKPMNVQHLWQNLLMGTAFQLDCAADTSRCIWLALHRKGKAQWADQLCLGVCQKVPLFVYQSVQSRRLYHKLVL